MIPEMLESKRDAIPKKTAKNKTIMINEEITQGMPVFKFSFFMIGRNTKESINESITGIITVDIVLHRKPVNTTAKKSTI